MKIKALFALAALSIAPVGLASDASERMDWDVGLAEQAAETDRALREARLKSDAHFQCVEEGFHLDLLEIRIMLDPSLTPSQRDILLFHVVKARWALSDRCCRRP